MLDHQLYETSCSPNPLTIRVHFGQFLIHIVNIPKSHMDQSFTSLLKFSRSTHGRTFELQPMQASHAQPPSAALPLRAAPSPAGYRVEVLVHGHHMSGRERPATGTLVTYLSSVAAELCCMLGRCGVSTSPAFLPSRTWALEAILAKSAESWRLTCLRWTVPHSRSCI